MKVFESENRKSRKSISSGSNQRDKLLEQTKTLHISTGNSKSADIDWGVAPFIREKGIFYIYVSELGGHVRSILNKTIYIVWLKMKYLHKIFGPAFALSLAETMEIHRIKKFRNYM